jgi:hypothetical protein
LKTLADAGMTPEHSDHINGPGTATPENDKMEYLAISTVFGEPAQQYRRTKVGHTISAAGTVEAVCNAEGCLTRIGDDASDLSATDQVHLSERGIGIPDQRDHPPDTGRNRRAGANAGR